VSGESSSSVDLLISDQSQLWALRDFLALAASDVQVSVSSGVPQPGEQGGVLDTLAVAGSTGALAAAINVLPHFLKARRSGIMIKTTVKGKPFTLTATNVDEVMPIINKILDA
jgi:Effector Associated Constant Component 1